MIAFNMQGGVPHQGGLPGQLVRVDRFGFDYSIASIALGNLFATIWIFLVLPE